VSNERPQRVSAGTHALRSARMGTFVAAEQVIMVRSLLLTGFDPKAKLRARFNCQTWIRQAIRAMWKKPGAHSRQAPHSPALNDHSLCQVRAVRGKAIYKTLRILSRLVTRDAQLE